MAHFLQIGQTSQRLHKHPRAAAPAGKQVFWTHEFTRGHFTSSHNRNSSGKCHPVPNMQGQLCGISGCRKLNTASGIFTGLGSLQQTTKLSGHHKPIHRASAGKKSRGRSGEEEQVIMSGALSLINAVSLVMWRSLDSFIKWGWGWPHNAVPQRRNHLTKWQTWRPNQWVAGVSPCLSQNFQDNKVVLVIVYYVIIHTGDSLPHSSKWTSSLYITRFMWNQQRVR